MKHENFPDYVNTDIAGFSHVGFVVEKPVSGAPLGFLAVKRAVDIAFAICLMPILLVTICFLLVANRFKNPGPLFFVQSRMGWNCLPFNAIKLRTMRCADVIVRDANGPLEEHRITPLGKLLRKARLDELPQVVNVLKGDMSLIGPRPDYFEHAKYFVEHVPGYRERHSVRPGISGLAQTEVGYAEGVEATRKKVVADLYYIKNRGFRLEAWVFWRTIVVVLGRGGA